MISVYAPFMVNAGLIAPSLGRLGVGLCVFYRIRFPDTARCHALFMVLAERLKAWHYALIVLWPRFWARFLCHWVCVLGGCRAADCRLLQW